MRRGMRVATAVAAAGVIAAGGITAATAGGAVRATTSGKLEIFATLHLGSINSATAPVVVTGVVGDWGTVTSVDADGKVDENGNFLRFKLQRGTMLANATKANKASNAQQPNFDKHTCSAWEFDSFPKSPITIYGGTGAYAGVKGQVIQTSEFGFVFKKSSNGACNPGQHTKPEALFGAIVASGHVSY